MKSAAGALGGRGARRKTYFARATAWVRRATKRPLRVRLEGPKKEGRSQHAREGRFARFQRCQRARDAEASPRDEQCPPRPPIGRGVGRATRRPRALLLQRRGICARAPNNLRRGRGTRSQRAGTSDELSRGGSSDDARCNAPHRRRATAKPAAPAPPRSSAARFPTLRMPCLRRGRIVLFASALQPLRQGLCQRRLAMRGATLPAQRLAVTCGRGAPTNAAGHAQGNQAPRAPTVRSIALLDRPLDVSHLSRQIGLVPRTTAC